MRQTHQLLCEPLLVIDCIKEGRWPGSNVTYDSNMSYQELTMRYGESYRIVQEIDPYFQHGYFNDDSELDVAITVREEATSCHGVAIVLAASEHVHLFGFEEEDMVSAGPWDLSFLHVSSGHPYESLTIGLKNGYLFDLTWDGHSFRRRVAQDHDPDPPEPELMILARKEGLWPSDNRYQILKDLNPAYIRGDFNGDGDIDLAVQVHDTEEDRNGIIFIHSTLDTLWSNFDLRGHNVGGYLRIIPKGTYIRPFSDLPPEYVIPPFTLSSDALEVGNPGQPWSGMYHWFNGQYRWVTLSD